MAAAVTDRTVLVVVSAPSYAHGVVDPVRPIAAMAAERGIRCHVDACIGGFVLPFLADEPARGIAQDRPAWSFEVPGVTSISADLHKYGYAPKGVSALVHRSMALRHSQFWATTDWPGYGVVNSTLQSTKSAGPLAAAWTTIQLLGEQGYAALARQARDGALALAAEVGGIPGLRVLVPPDSSLLAVVTDDSCDPYTVCDELLERGWFAQPQLPFRGGPASLHLTISAATTPQLPEFVGALADSVAAAQVAGPVAVDPAMVGLLATLDPATFDEATLGALLAVAGLTGAGGALQLPRRMAAIQALLAACPPALRRVLLTAVVERL
jgi:glutamate/tyrosine decarboxylase-like PLP-dependent enzyme